MIANSRGPETLARLVTALGPQARAATAADAAAAGDFVVIAVPLKLVNNMPVQELAGKIVIDTNNYMAWRDGLYAVIESREATEHELRQQQLPTSKVVKAFTHIQAPRIITAGQPADTPGRLALAVSSNYPETVELVARLYDQFGFDTVDHSPLSESWRSRPGQPAWTAHWRQTREELEGNLAKGSAGPLGVKLLNAYHYFAKPSNTDAIEGRRHRGGRDHPLQLAQDAGVGAHPRVLAERRFNISEDVDAEAGDAVDKLAVTSTPKIRIIEKKIRLQRKFLLTGERQSPHNSPQRQEIPISRLVRQLPRGSESF